MTKKLMDEIKSTLKRNRPFILEDRKLKMYRSRNPDNPAYVIYGIKMKDIESIVKTIYKQNSCSYRDAIEIFRHLIKSDIAEEKFAALYFLNCFKKEFNEDIIDLFYDEYSDHCNTWALCDSTCLKVLGPFLNKKDNFILAKSTIEKWSQAENIWIKRASLVILLKLIMLKKDYFVSKSFLFNIVESLIRNDEDYIQKAVGWLLKTCSKYKQDDIAHYLNKRKKSIPRLILRYASEKLPKEKRTQILTRE